MKYIKYPLREGLPIRYLDAIGDMPALSPNGRFLAFTQGHCRITREAYRGPANRDIWIYDTQEKSFHSLTSHEGQDIYPRWGGNETLYFLSARNGIYNIHRLSLDGSGKAKGEPFPMTAHEEDGIRYFHVSSQWRKA